jgi:hypothetical protein
MCTTSGSKQIVRQCGTNYPQAGRAGIEHALALIATGELRRCLHARQEKLPILADASAAGQRNAHATLAEHIAHCAL